MQNSDFEISPESTNVGAPPPISGDTPASHITSALNQGDHQTAGNLLRIALEHSPNDSQLLRLAAKQRRQAERYSRVYSLLKETAEAMEGDEFVRAVGAYREAVNLSLGVSELEEATFQTGVDKAAELGHRNWRIARTLLEDAGRISPKLIVPEQRWHDVKAAEREETVANVLEETAMAKPADLGRARERLVRTLEQYPADTALANRLKSIESTIEDKRKFDERAKCLKKLSDLRDAMQREEDPAALAKYLPQSGALAGLHAPEPEFSSILEDIKHQVISAENAAAALKQDRLEDCLEECAWVLSRMRHHQVFLNLKKKAEERELSLADEYSYSVLRIKELLAAGKLAEADVLCTKASAQLPQFAGLQELKQQIAERRSKEELSLPETNDNTLRLMERGERQLREQQYRLAEQSFSSALKLSPDDKKLPAQIAGLLLGYARSVVRDNPQSAEETLHLTERLLPGTVIPADLAEAVRPKRQQTKDEAASALFSKLDGKTADFDRQQARRSVIYRAISIAATLLLGTGLVYWMNDNHLASPVPEKPKVVETSRVAPPAPVASVAMPSEPIPEPAKSAETLLDAKLTPKPAHLEIHASEPDLQIRLDGVPLRSASARKWIEREIPPGQHAIELSRSGFLPKTLTRTVAPGEVLLLSARDLHLESADTRAAAVVPPPPAPKPDEIEWQSLDKNNVDALRSFVSQYPNSSYSNQAKQQIDAALTAREDSDWNSTDHTSRVALEDFLKRHPDGRHASVAGSSLAEIERKARLAERESAEEAAWKKVNRRDEAALTSYLRDNPSSRFRSEAEADLATVRQSKSASSESAAVLTVISRLASAWSARDPDSIVAIQRNLNKREVKAELAHVKEIEMQISPTSPPQIDGTQAVVSCRRQALQTFSDGTRKQIPESVVSFVLVKHDGTWTIEGTK